MSPAPYEPITIELRADEVLATAGQPSRLPPSPLPPGQRFHLALRGAPSFSPVELARLAPGANAADNLGALRLLRALVAAAPDSLALHPTTALDTRVFWPTSTLADVSLNLAVAQIFRLSELLPGLLAPCPNEDAAVSLLARALELLRDAETPDAPPAAREAWAATPLALALALCDTIEERPEIDSPGGLYAPALEALAAPSYRALSTDDSASGPLDGRMQLAMFAPTTPLTRELFHALPQTALPETLAFLAGLKPVCRLESLAPESRESVLRHLRPLVDGLVVRSRARPESERGAADLFLGRDEALVDELVALAGTASSLDEEPGEVVRRSGELLGYPACCREAFAEAARAGDEAQIEWLLVSNRVRHSGRLPAESRALTGPLSYAPCRADCPAHREQIERLRAFGVDPCPSAAAHWPVLFLLDRPNQHAVLEPLDPVGPVFRYRLESTRGSDPRLLRLRDGDRLVVAAGQLEIRNEERLLWRFNLDAYLWWNEAPFHAPFWREVVAQRLSGPPTPAAALSTPPAQPAPPLDRVLGWLKTRLVAAGLPCAHILPEPDGALSFAFAQGGAPALRLRWTLRAPRAGEPALAGLALEGAPAPDLPRLAEALRASLEPLLRRGLGEHLDRRNRAIREVPTGGGLRYLLGNRFLPGHPAWADYVVERFEESAERGLGALRLTLRRGETRVVLDLAPGAEGELLLDCALGRLVLRADERPPAWRDDPAHQVERAVAFTLARAIPPEARWVGEAP